MPSPRPAVLSPGVAMLLFAVVVAAWGGTWVVTKVIVQSVTPLWTTALRSALAAVALLVLLLARGQFIVPGRGDAPVVLAIGLLHMVGFAALVAFGLKYVPVGRSIVLGYTTPLWVAPGAWLLLGEAMTRRRVMGIALGLAGVVVMFNPLAYDWSDDRALLGNGMILLAALCWAMSILYVRTHTWISTPFQLVFWEALLAAATLSILALWIDGAPRVDWTPGLVAAFLYAGVIGTALGYWAMAMVSRAVSAVTASLGVLATPVIGVVVSAVAFGEVIDLPLVIAMAMILGGIAIGTIPLRSAREG